MKLTGTDGQTDGQTDRTTYWVRLMLWLKSHSSVNSKDIKIRFFSRKGFYNKKGGHRQTWVVIFWSVPPLRGQIGGTPIFSQHIDRKSQKKFQTLSRHLADRDAPINWRSIWPPLIIISHTYLRSEFNLIRTLKTDSRFFLYILNFNKIRSYKTVDFSFYYNVKPNIPF